ncbi:MAG TPA: imidazolonepropionase [Chloroflexia bacterium]|nr:imidazolonepropionase [Chloroflexia bacterium]
MPPTVDTPPAAPADLIIVHAAELLTMAGPAEARRGPQQAELGLMPDGAVAISGDTIRAVGPTAAIRAAHAGPETRIVDASRRVVTPGLVDAHTHLVFAGTREHEYEQRLQGAGYLEILAAGGGIMSTVRATRAASAEELAAGMVPRLRAMLAHGTTTVEVKSGYGLSTEDELKSLRAIRITGTGRAPGQLGEALPRLCPTFLGAHAVPEEYRDQPDAYVDLLVEETLPAVAAAGLAESCDVFCDAGAFDAAQARRVLEAAQAHGLPVRLHANEFERIGAAALAADLHALSADHLLVLDADEIAALAAAGVVATLLPGTGLGLGHYAPARALIAAGVPVALATDCNPGTCLCENLALMIALACTAMKMTPAEALVAATINSAHALGPRWAAQVGSLEPGKRADLVIWDVPNYRHIPYHFGVNLVGQVVLGGVLV